ncbi:MAG: toxin-antitoxin system antitoxin subunit [Bacteroidales bacterium]|nr:toxin-antitoxin system antitoxin subunit [Bacteroidales bacterium]
MSDALESTLLLIETMLKNCTIDYNALQNASLDETFFDDYNNTRIVNSFLFNFSKLQDKIGAKLFKQVLYELKEIDTFSLTMIDVLNRLEKLNILDTTEQWERLREIRNILAHEYPFDTEERIENITLAMEGFIELKSIYTSLKKALQE